MVSTKKLGACLILLGVTLMPAYVSAARSKKQSAQKSGAVNEIKNADEFNKALAEHKGKKSVLVKFYTVGCGPCTRIEPIVRAAAKDHKDVAVLAVSSNNAGNLLSKNNIRAFPTLLFINTSGKVVDRHEGALSKEALDAKLAKLSNK